jgi:predicted metal-dependent HD superfamily phosphohydrolase
MPSHQRWHELCRALGGQPGLFPWYERLEALYAESHRHYHTFDHIADCLNEFDAARHLSSNPMAVEIALWFHDAIYDPRASDNEQRSADLANCFLEQAGTGGQHVTDGVLRLILATWHDSSPTDQDSGVMIDVDLSILGRSPTVFAEYESQIRSEYAWVPPNIFAARRAEILERFLARPRIYSSDLFLNKYEKQARTNLKNSIKTLRSPAV